MKKEPKIHGFFLVLLKINMLPLVILTLVITTFSAIIFASSMNVETKNGLVNMCHTVISLYDAIYEGDYHAQDSGSGMQMYKGEHLIADSVSIIDSIKDKTGIDITIFYQDTRAVTTVRTSSGVRVTGTKANNTVIEDVLIGSKPHFYASTMVGDVRYFSYYEPLYAADGSCIGMFFLGKPSAEVEKLVLDSVTPTIIFGIITMLIVGLLTIRFSNKLVNAIQRMDSFVLMISKGELHTKLDDDILERKDELGQMSRGLVKMQGSLRELVEQDLLTGLYNRRNGEKLLKQTCENYRNVGTPFCVAIGDIDHFKNVNDTYGHECGDIALAMISKCIKEHMQDKGFVARWGGEEILLVYNNMPLDTAVSHISELLDEIRGLRITYGDTTFGITMTFGITQGNDSKVEHIVRDADTKLYEGKNSGRNKIVY